MGGIIVDYFLQYVNVLRLDERVSTGLKFIIWPFIFGLILSFFIIFYKRRVIGAFVRAIRNAGAVDETTAKTLSELGQEYNTSATNALKKSASLRRMITICQAQAASEGQEPNSDVLEIDENTRFYIDKDAETRARIQYGDKEESLWPIIIGSVALILFGLFVFFILLPL